MPRRLRVIAAVLASIVAFATSAHATDSPPAQEVQLIAEEPNLTYWIYGNPPRPGGQDDSKKIGFMTTFRVLCTVPCSAPLGPGTYTLGVSRLNGSLVPVPAMTLKGDEVLKARYRSQWAMRLAFLVGGFVTASIGAAVAFSGDPSGSRQAAGVGVLALGVVGMATPIFIQDNARIEAIKP